MIHFDANGGYTSAEDVILTPSDGNPIDFSTPVTLPTADQTYRLNHRLTGWNTAADGTGTSYAPGAVKTAAELGAALGVHTTLYAQWETAAWASYTVEHWQEKIETPGDYTLVSRRNVNDFDGNTVTPEVNDYAGFKAPPAQTVTLTAAEPTLVQYYYDRVRYTVVLDGNGADSGTMANVPMVREIAKTLPANAFVKANSVFLGWNTAPDGSGTGYGDGQTVNNLGADGSVVTLYAQWATLHTEDLGESQGSVTVTAKAGQQIVFENLPAGVTYEIEEINIPQGWEQTDQSGLTGSIAPAAASSAAIENTYSAVGYATFEAHKILEGDTLAPGQFTFEFGREGETTPIGTATNGPLDELSEYVDASDAVIQNPWYNTAPVLFQSVELTAPGEYKFWIREIAGTDANITYDDHIETVTVTATDAGNGTLNTVVTYDADGPVFTNAMSTGSVSLTKQVLNATDAASETEFAFTVTLQDANGNPLTGTYPVTLSNGTTATVTNGGTITLKDGETAKITDLPHKSTYVFTEQEKPGFELTGQENDTGEIIAGAESNTAVFTNTYSTSGSAQLAARKNVVGGNVADYSFQFELTDNAGSVVERVTASADGSITFTPIDFTAADDGKTFTYYISEVAGSDPMIQYDSHEETVSVYVHDDGEGHLIGDVTYDSDGAVFTNTQLVTLTLTKEVAGSMGNKDDQYEFHVTIGGENHSALLSHGESQSWNVVPGTSYSIRESGAVGYTVSHSENGGASQNGRTASGTVSGDTTVKFTNTLNTSVATGIFMNNIGWIVGGVGLLGLILMGSKLRRRKDRDDET